MRDAPLDSNTRKEQQQKHCFLLSGFFCTSREKGGSLCCLRFGFGDESARNDARVQELVEGKVINTWTVRQLIVILENAGESLGDLQDDQQRDQWGQSRELF